MDTVFENFYSKLGRNIYQSKSSSWVEIHKGMLLSIPFNKIISPTDRELDDLISRANVFGVRYPTNIDSFGFYSYQVNCRTINYSFSNLSVKSRNQVRQGFKNCEVRLVSKFEFLASGYSLYLQTLTRQGRNDFKSEKDFWLKFSSACYSTEGVKIYGAFSGDKLAAYMVVIETSDFAEIIMQNSDSNYLKFRPNNALTYYVTQHYLTSRAPPLPLCYGIGSLEATDSLDKFKLGMGYDLEEIKQRIYFKKCLRPLLNKFTLFFLDFLTSVVFRKMYFIRKCHGLLVNYLRQV